MRSPLVAGQFYESDPKNLRNQIKSCFDQSFDNKNKEVFGVIAPHAGYIYSGPCQAHSFNAIKNTRPDTIIIIGLSHRGYPSCLSLEDWKTPLGILKVDKKFQDCMKLPIREDIHAIEHSIEVQLPFIQYLWENVKIAPIIASPDISTFEIAKQINNAVNKSGRNMKVIVSSDFTHFGSAYNYIPFVENVKENLYSLDREAIKLIENLDAGGLQQYIQKTGATICGQSPISVFLELCILRKIKKGLLLQYYTSGDVVKNYSQAVGYAALSF